MRAKVLAMTQETCEAFRAMGACSRDEPQPKFLPATTTSPGFTFFTKSLSMSSMQWLASSAWEAVFRYRAGMITSVFTSSPYLCTVPFAFIAISLLFSFILGGAHSPA